MSKKLFSILALLLSMTLLATACGDDTGTEGETETPAEEPTTEAEATEPTEEPATEPPTEEPTAELPAEIKIAYQGPLTGDNAALGINMLRGVELAVKEANDAGELGTNITVEQLDSQGNPDQAPPLAQQAAADEAVLAVIGPSFSGETQASGDIYEEAGLPMLTPSATNPDLSGNGWTNFFRTVATDATQGPVAARFIAENLGATKVAVIDDASEYGLGLADIVEQSLTEDFGAEIVAREGIEAGGTDFSTVVGTVVQSGAEAVFYGGYFSDAGNLRRQLVENGGQDITFVSDDGTFDGGFIENAGAAAAEGSYVTFPGADPLSADPAFLESFRAEYDNEDPGAFTIEAYQNTLLVIEALKGGATDRASIAEFVRSFDGEIFGKQISFDENGDIAAQSFFIYQVEGGTFVQKEQVEAETAA